MQESESRGDCYCSIWDEDPQFLREQGLPEGFCGFCDSCEKPGHVRHYPGPKPITGSWCDEHYDELASGFTCGPLGCILIFVLLAALAWAVYTWVF